MKFVEKIEEIREMVKNEKHRGKKIGFVPTMGCLHEGHLSLIRKAKEISDCVVVSIFVNPMQFGPNEDFDKYPRTLENDMKLIKNEGVFALFHPSIKEMYPNNFSSYVEIKGKISEIMCGARRIGHFRGVATVVSKLFNIITPDIAVFGQKDAQQAKIIQKMVKELNFDVKIVISKTIREEDGLAMSSRNSYLNKEERCVAPLIYEGLMNAKRAFEFGEKSSEKLKEIVKKTILKSPLFTIDYIELVDYDTFEEIEKVEVPSLLSVACFLSKTRLIDNVILGGEDAD